MQDEVTRDVITQTLEAAGAGLQESAWLIRRSVGFTAPDAWPTLLASLGNAEHVNLRP